MAKREHLVNSIKHRNINSTVLNVKKTRKRLLIFFTVTCSFNIYCQSKFHPKPRGEALKLSMLCNGKTNNSSERGQSDKCNFRHKRFVSLKDLQSSQKLNG